MTMERTINVSGVEWKPVVKFDSEKHGYGIYCYWETLDSNGIVILKDSSFDWQAWVFIPSVNGNGEEHDEEYKSALEAMKGYAKYKLSGEGN